LPLHEPGCSGTPPLVRPKANSGRVLGRPLPREADRRDKALLSALTGNSASVRRTRPDRGVREMLAPSQVATRGPIRTQEICLPRVR
jgi:hypothetical protein